MSLDKIKKCIPGRTRPLICLEVNPPKGVTYETIFQRLDGAVDGVDFFNVTDSALARMRCAPLPFASLLKQRYGIEPLVNVSCRDRNIIALQSDLLSGWMLGIRSIVALTGDAVSVGDMPEAKGVFELNSIGLLNMVKHLNGGFDAAKNALAGAPAFAPGVVVNANARNVGPEIRRLQKKLDAGAFYALSQPVFDVEAAVSFLKQASTVKIPIFLGLMPLRNAAAATAVSAIPGIKVAEHVAAKLAGLPDKEVQEISLAHCLEIAKATREFIAGYHVVCGAAPKLGLKLAQTLVAEANSW